MSRNNKTSMTRGGVWRSCKSKDRYRDEHAASKGLRRGWRVYPCSNCGGYHRTSKRDTRRV